MEKRRWPYRVNARNAHNRYTSRTEGGAIEAFNCAEDHKRVREEIERMSHSVAENDHATGPLPSLDFYDTH